MEHSSASQQASESSLGPQNQEQIIQELLSAMTLEEKVGQMFLSAALRPAGPSWPPSISWGLSAVRPGFQGQDSPAGAG